jgi:hypothetical protein
MAHSLGKALSTAATKDKSHNLHPLDLTKAKLATNTICPLEEPDHTLHGEWKYPFTNRNDASRPHDQCDGDWRPTMVWDSTRPPTRGCILGDCRAADDPNDDPPNGLKGPGGLSLRHPPPPPSKPDGAVEPEPPGPHGWPWPSRPPRPHSPLGDVYDKTDGFDPVEPTNGTACGYDGPSGGHPIC